MSKYIKLEDAIHGVKNLEMSLKAMDSVRMEKQCLIKAEQKGADVRLVVVTEL